MNFLLIKTYKIKNNDNTKVVSINNGGIKMKGIKLILLSFMAAAMLTSCGMNNTNDNTSPSPESTVNTK